MRHLLALIILFGCNTSDNGVACTTDDCVCPLNGPCSHQCSPGGPPCQVHCAPHEPCSTVCAAGERCEVEAHDAATCSVDCNGSPDCQVICPPTGCTVHDCALGSCEVVCAFGAPSRSGTTATCQ